MAWEGHGKLQEGLPPWKAYEGCTVAVSSVYHWPPNGHTNGSLRDYEVS